MKLSLRTKKFGYLEYIKKILFFIYILLFSACVSMAKSTRQTASFKPGVEFNKWLGRICVSKGGEFFYILRYTLHKENHIHIEGPNQRETDPFPHFIGRVEFEDGHVAEYMVKKCENSDSLSLKDISKWLEQAAVCGASNAQGLAYTLLLIHNLTPFYVRLDSEFYHVTMRTPIGFTETYKVGIGKHCIE